LEIPALNRRAFLPLLTALAGARACGATRPRHYVFLGQEREALQKPEYFAPRALEGAQIAYSWRRLEPRRDRYDFEPIDADLAVLQARGKRLWVQIQDVSFSEARVHVPEYLRNEPSFSGGAARKYSVPEAGEAQATVEGWVARRWDPAVQARLHALFQALARKFDGRIAGVNLAETAVDFGESGRLYPPGFTPAGYRDAIITNMKALRAAFAKSEVLQYANFMPGEWLPVTDRGYLRSVYQAAERANVGVGGPDLLPYRRGQLSHSYPLIRAASGKVCTGIAVQDGNYEHRNPSNGRTVTARELLTYASESLGVRFLFWCTQEPYYREQVIPLLQTL
jgi:hypothetical protein